ncbi:MAG TPA: hypothetical protein VKV17_17910 [Bryobacteraceae bacterium]|nr:hypothetical protein [Bryobacteraceae bacterium]
MAFKSNKEARAEYLANEQKNRERNRAAYARRKRKKARVNWLVLFVLIVIALFLIKRQGGVWLMGRPAITPAAGRSR